VTQRDQRIEPAGAPRRQPGGEGRHRGEHRRRRREGQRIVGTDPDQQPAEQADEQSGGGEPDRLTPASSASASALPGPIESGSDTVRRTRSSSDS
jgi:hypothetical protein